MRTPVVMTLVLGCTLVVGCSKEEEQPPPATPNAYQQQPQPYPQQYPAQQQQYPAQQYPAQPAPVQQPAPAAAPAAPAAAPAAGQMATPGPLALPCQNDAACGTGKCNLQYQKCAYPCMSQADCQPGNACNTATGFCLPGAAPAQ
jgi:predicted lipid-binding transport protein (Tim44 family)